MVRTKSKHSDGTKRLDTHKNVPDCMKCPTWLDKERLYRIIFLADTPAGKTYDVLLIIGILASIITLLWRVCPHSRIPFN